MGAVWSLVIIGVAVLLILGIKLLGSPKTARWGNRLAAIGMLVGLLALPDAGGEPVWQRDWDLNYLLIVSGIVVGLALGALGAYSVKMTAMPQMVALFNGLGGGAAALVGGLEFARAAATQPEPLILPFGDPITGADLVIAPEFLRSVMPSSAAAMLFATLIGALAFTGSVVAYLKLNGKLERPRLFRGQHIVNALLFIAALALGGWLAFNATGSGATALLLLLAVLALLFGVALVLPIGGADMPVVISLLNSFTGLAVAADGLVIGNLAMLVAGTLVGSSGTLLTLLMCRAMNRPVGNVLFGAFGSGGGGPAAAGALAGKSVKSIQADEAALLLSYARQVVIVPGYGLAVAQAQHQVCELAEELGQRGVEVCFAIHPVAGRMPGHMNVLLAEANIPYDQLHEMEAVNPVMERVDVCLVIGANDVVNPAAREEPASPIYGMPIIEADRAKAVIVLKRSMAAGFAGIDNHLFYKDNTRMLFGDAKASLTALVSQVKAS
ncbi:MAG: NAD(P)(+) transhydrogenase (Re/Si-specific) subunit beta [Verrucomicrobiales bacterium]|jgi:NAD(P) transhydrogenase subunit beta|nr:NAD(P)(+) transhydrogenase (Re/Si-specific) subunit beta [Verrucomicrobiales bacterium]